MKVSNFKVDSFGKTEYVISTLVVLLLLGGLVSGGSAEAKGSMHFDKVLMMAIVTAGFAALPFAVLKIKKQSPVEVLGLEKKVPRKVLIQLVGLWVVSTLVALFVKIGIEAGIGDSTAVQVVSETGNGFGELAKGYIALALIIPFAEELIFRGYLYGVIKKLGGMVVAAVVVATLFALIHDDYSSIPHFIGLSMVAIWGLEKTGSIWAPFFVHALNNTFVFIILASQLT